MAILLEAKADNGSTAFLHACFKGGPESIALLAQAGARETFLAPVAPSAKAPSQPAALPQPSPR